MIFDNYNLLYLAMILATVALNASQCYRLRKLENINLSSLSYETIHKIAIQDQVRNHVQAQKSLDTRQTKSLNGLWNFCFDDKEEGFAGRWFSSSLNAQCRQGNLYRMPVPSAFNDITSNTTAQNYIGWFWYQTSVSVAALTLAKANSGSQWYLQFESINYLALVWISRSSQPKSGNNNHFNDDEDTIFLGSHVGGHLPFLLNITTRNSSWFETGQHRLTVAVNNKLTKDTIPSGKMLNLSEQVGREFEKFQPDFDFFHFAGIMGNVNLFTLPECHFTHIDTLTQTIEQGNTFSTATIITTTTGTSSTNQASGWTSLNFNVCHQGCRLVPAHYGELLMMESQNEIKLGAQLLSTEGQFIGSKLISTLQTEIQTMESFSCNAVEFIIDKEASRFLNWAPISNVNSPPRLLVARFELIAPTLTTKAEATIVDLFDLKVGLRTNNFSAELAAGNHQLSTGQLQGFGMHHEQLFSGRTMSLSSIMKDIYLLKQVGTNLIRTSHYPYSREYLEACDEHGIMVIAECPAVGLNTFGDTKLTLHKQILIEMMQRDHHHPSIIMWSVANEPQSQKVESKTYFRSLLQFARDELAQYTVLAGRPLTAAIAQSHKDDRLGQYLDVIMVNRYFGWYDDTGVLEAIRLPLFESLAGWSRRFPGKPLILSEFGADTVVGLHSSTRMLFSEEYQRDLLVEHERVVDEIIANKNSSGINLIGSMIWNFADFSTHDSLLRVGGNRKGIFTRERQPKMSVSSIRGIYLNRTSILITNGRFQQRG